MQLAVNQLKPLFLEPIKARVTDDQYLIVIYVSRTLITAAAYLWIWGGVSATRAVVPLLPDAIPDIGVGIVTVALVVLGEEVIHPLVERAYILRDIAKLLKQGTIDNKSVQASIK